MFGLLGPRDRNASDDPEAFRAPLAEHLDELRGRVIRIAIILVVAFTIAWFIQPPIYAYLTKLVRELIPKTADYKEAFNSFTGPFMLKMRLAGYMSLILGAPFIVRELWGFVEPGLKENEKKPLRTVVPISVGLFFLGCFFGFLIIPTTTAWFVSYLEEFPGTALFQEPGTMVFFILKLLLSFGLGFQLPVIVFALVKVGILTPQTLKTYWRQAAFGIFFGSALLTPSNDWFTMLMMAVPLTILFFGSMAAVRLTNRHQLHAPELDELD